ncbi:MAG: condensation domain-containing protein, partial [Giesbergeria sp.]
MYLATRTWPTLPMYHVRAAATLRMQLDLPLLEEALNRVAQEQDILRTVVVSQGFGRPVQIVLERVAYKIALLEGASDEQFFETQPTGTAVLAERPSMAIQIVKTGPDEYRLLQFFHHLLLDGWSNAMVFTRIMETYSELQAAKARNETMPAAHCATGRFREFVAYQERQRSDPSARAFWRNELTGATAVDLPLDRQSTDPRNYRTQIEERLLDNELQQRLHAKARALGYTLSDLLFTAYGLLLASLSNSTDFIAGFSVSVRPAEIPGCNQIAGMFLNTIPVRLTIDRDLSLGQQIASVRETLTRCREFEDFPLTEIVTLARAERAEARGPLIRTLYTSETYPGARLPAGMQGVGFYNWHMTELD